MAAAITEEPSNEQILEAIEVLRRAGINISVNTKNLTDSTPAKYTSEGDANPSSTTANKVNPSAYINSEYEAINMMLGNGNNNNKDPMMNMLPYMLNQNNEGKNIDPQVIQSLMMNAMMSGLSELNSSDNK